MAGAFTRPRPICTVYDYFFRFSSCSFQNRIIWSAKTSSFPVQPYRQLPLYVYSGRHMTHEDYRHTSRDPNDRVPDLRRTESLNWVRKIIERYPCAVENSCGEIWYWEEMFRGRVRCNLLYASEKFLIVLEKAKDVYFIITTSFYLDTDWAFEKRRRKYEKYKQQKTPLA